MAKLKTQVPMQKPKDLVSHDIPLPEEAHSAIREESPKTLQIRFSKKTLTKVGEIIDSLLISRQIADPDTIHQGDGTVMALAVIEPDMDVDEIIRRVQHFHRKWAKSAQRDAGIIALTLQTKLKDTTPLPYKAEDLEDELEAEDEREDWEGRTITLPPPVPNLTNPYERRLKQFLDMLELTDLQFQIKVGRLLNNIVIQALRQGAVETDDAGFPAGSTGRGGDVPSLPENKTIEIVGFRDKT